MYASYTFTVLFKIWEKIDRFYEYSLLRKICKRLKDYFNLLSSGSLLMTFLTRESILLESSLICRIYYTVVDIVNSLFRKLNAFFVKSLKQSYSYNLITKIRTKCLKNSNSDLEIIIRNSYFIKIIIYIFTLDEDNGGKQWW